MSKAFWVEGTAGVKLRDRATLRASQARSGSHTAYSRTVRERGYSHGAELLPH